MCEKCQPGWAHVPTVFEFLVNSLTQTNQKIQKFIRLYYLNCWIQMVQFNEQNNSLTNCTISK